ncbi:Protein CBG26268 [Caenorhabditis briggsae]|nr:Protein CBG26268 [Caenorhabditis briggsae]CAR99641.1 Protein CBG26268 [Caenorhabditis briggsae]
MMPYETPLDLLHNLGEGICERIMRELMSQRTKLSVKSQLFVADSSRVETEMTTVILPSELSNVHKNRNGTDKLTKFRCVLSSVAIHSDVIGPKGRFTIIALAMTVNRMFTNANARGVFDIQMTAAANWFIQEASTEYLSS